MSIEQPAEPDKQVAHIKLTKLAWTFVDRIREETGVPKVEALSRLLEWFATLDRKVLLAVLNRDEDTKRELAATVLSQMAGVSEAQRQMAVDPTLAKIDLDQATALIRLLADRIDELGGTLKRTIKQRPKA